MKLIVLFLTVAILQVSATSRAQNITMKKNKASLEQVIKEIRQQSGYDFFYNLKLIQKATPITVNLKDVPLEVALQKVFENQPLSYTVTDIEKAVVVKEKEKGFFANMMENIQSIDVRGKVLDEAGQPLVGATVSIKGKNRSVKTNSEGVFYMENVAENDKLVISYIGYQNREVDAASEMGSLTMSVIDSELEEVKINAGYYSVTDKERTGSISRITSKDIEKQPVNNVLAAMQANIPGVQIIQNTGVPGGGFSVQIRGQNSLQQGSDPLYIIDGVPFRSNGIAGTRSSEIISNPSPLSTLSPNDIQSIEVLKDADATAIYGSRGANGVVLITTKKGISGQTNIFSTISHGISKVGRTLDLMNTTEYLSMRREALKNDNLPISPADYDLNGVWGETKYTNWQKELIGGTAPSTTVQTSITGGSDNLSYLVSGNYYNEATVFPGDASFERASGKINLKFTSNNRKLSMSTDITYSESKNNLFRDDLTRFVTLAPNHPDLLDDNGFLNWDNNRLFINPLANIQQTYKAKTNNLIGNIVIDYKIIENLNLKASFGYTNMDRKELGSNPLAAYSPALNYGASARRSNFTNNSFSTWISEAQADWSKRFNSGNLTVLLGSTLQQNLTDGQEVSGTGFTSDALMENIASASTLTVSNRSYLKYRYSAIFARINYNLFDKYIINVTGRRDGSTRFSNFNRFANFGAIGAAWLVSEESFIKRNFNFLNFAKIRGSYGITGNDQIPDYGYLELWQVPFPGIYQGISGMAPISIANPNYGWEVNKKAEIGLEIGVIENKLNFSLGFFSSRSSSQLVQRQLTPSTGFSFINDNLPAIVGNRGWEIYLSSTNISNNRFTWKSSFNLTIPRNRLIAYPGLETSNYANTYTIGEPLALRKLYKTYVDSQTGLYRVEDLDGNGIIDFDKDLYINKSIGRTLYGGIQNTISSNGFELDFLFQVVKQNAVSPNFSTPGGFFYNSPTSNQPREYLNRWQQQGDNAEYQKYSTSTSARNSFLNSKLYGSQSVEDASFIRLKNVSISYNIRKQFLERFGIKNMKVFLQGQNLITFTRYQGFDPETLNRFVLPTLQVFNGGIQLTL